MGTIWDLRGESVSKLKLILFTLSVLCDQKALRYMSRSSLSIVQAPKHELICSLTFLPPSLHNLKVFLFVSPWPRHAGKLEIDGLGSEWPATPSANTTCHSYSLPSPGYFGPSTSRSSHYFFTHASFDTYISSLPSFSVMLPLMHLWCSSFCSNIRNAH